MSGPAIQSIGSGSASAVQFAPPTARTAVPTAASQPAAGAGAASPAGAPAVALELSELARALEKMAQLPGMDEQTLTRIMTLVKGQGEMTGLLEMLKASGAPAASGAGTPAQAPALPEELKPFAEALQALFTPAAGEGSAPGEAPGPANTKDFQAKVAQAVQTLMASAKGAAETLNPSVLKAGLTQFVQSQFDQVSALFKQISGRVAGAGDAQPANAASQAGAAPLAAGMQELAAPAQAVAELLRQFKTAGKLIDTPLLRQDYIRSTLGIVAALLTEPVVAKTQTPAASTPAAPQTPAQAAEQAAGQQGEPAAKPPGTPSAPGQSELQAAAEAAPEPDGAQTATPTTATRAQSLLLELQGLKPVLTPAGQTILSQVEPLLTILAHAAETEATDAQAKNPQPATAKQAADAQGAPTAGRIAEVIRRGVSFELEARDDRRLDTVAAELNKKEIKAEVVRGERPRLAVLRVTLPGADPKADPVKIGQADPSTPPRHASTAEGKTAAKATGTANAASGGGKGVEMAKTGGFAPLTLGGGEVRDVGPGSAPGSQEAGRARHEQYTHPEAFRMTPQAQQDAAMIQMVGFFQARRAEAIQGQAFTASPAEQAAPVRLMLEYKPIEVIRPEQVKSDGASGKAATADDQQRIIDVTPISVSKS